MGVSTIDLEVTKNVLINKTSARYVFIQCMNIIINALKEVRNILNIITNTIIEIYCLVTMFQLRKSEKINDI